MDYKKHYSTLVNRAKERTLDSYTESHHIIPRCMGGSDNPDNLVRLTPEEHYVAHLLLIKMYPEHKGLVWAAVMMTGHNSDKRNNNKMYGWLKRKYQLVAKSRTGSKNGSYKTIWINKIGTTKNKKIGYDEIIPNGWQRGRQIREKVVRFCECGNELSPRATICKICKIKKFPIPRQTKLTEDDVIEIKKKLADGETRINIAKIFNVSKWAVIDIDLGRTWADV